MRAPLARLLLLALPFAGCGGERGQERAAADTAAPPADAAEIRRVLQESDRRFERALNQGNAGVAAEIYAEDSRLLPPNADPIEGRERIRLFWEGAVEQLGLAGYELTPLSLQIECDRAYEVGTYRLTVNRPGGATGLPDQGKYIVVWARQPDRTWRWVEHMWNTSLPPSDDDALSVRRAPPPAPSGSELLGRPVN